jgi:hypothetical protein
MFGKPLTKKILWMFNIIWLISMLFVAAAASDLFTESVFQNK